jgi:hypothetical protein
MEAVLLPKGRAYSGRALDLDHSTHDDVVLMV